jgi:nitrate reductase cytochrome c-type subunit
MGCAGIQNGVVPNAHVVTKKNYKCLACHKKTLARP